MIIIFAGAGASKAVNPDVYPTTVDFFQKLPGDIRKDALFDLVLQYLRRVEGKEAVIDIEKVLWALQDLRFHMEAVNSDGSALGWFLRPRRMSSLIQGQPEFDPLLKAAGPFIARLDELMNTINRQVYEQYSHVPTEKELKVWTFLLANVFGAKERVELVTTNYDLVLEAALRTMKNHPEFPTIDTGRREHVTNFLDVTPWTNRTSGADEDRDKGGLLTKLHGSVDWTRGRDTIFVGDPTFKGRHKAHAILYPGFKGAPTTSPFNVFHNYFSQCLRNASGIAFIGFAFRDEHINVLLDRYLNPEAKVVVLNPEAELSTIPFSQSRVRHIASVFESGVVEQVVSGLL